MARVNAGMAGMYPGAPPAGWDGPGVEGMPAGAAAICHLVTGSRAGSAILEKDCSEPIAFSRRARVLLSRNRPIRSGFVAMPSDNDAGFRILIVEDHPDGADSMAMLLRIDGYDVDIARDGLDAVEKARAFQPDVVLLDLGLPGMSGYEVARQMSVHRPERTPLLVAVTGYGRDEDRRRSAEAGIDLHLVKPVEPHQLCSVLERFRRAVDE
jgi:CheY-like chemotaxis protein